MVLNDGDMVRTNYGFGVVKHGMIWINQPETAVVKTQEENHKPTVHRGYSKSITITQNAFIKAIDEVMSDMGVDTGFTMSDYIRFAVLMCRKLFG